MSWKSFITASLLCILAVPAFGAATAPELEVINDGLDANGNWVWYVRVAPSDAARTNDPDAGGPIPTGSPMAVELGFKVLAGGKFTAVDNIGYSATPGNLWDTDTPAKTIFGWEDKWQIIDPTSGLPNGTRAAEGLTIFCGTHCDHDGTPPDDITLTNNAPLPGGNPANNHPKTYDSTLNDANDGLSPNGPAPANGDNSELVVALGSNTQNSSNTTTAYAIANLNVLDVSNATAIGQGTQMLKITTAGPKTGSLTTTLQLIGSHGASNNEGRIAEITTGTNGTNYKGFLSAGVTNPSVTVALGDTNLDRDVDVTDLANLAGGFGQPNGNWKKGDFDGDGDVDVTDLANLAGQFGTTNSGSYTKLAIIGTNDPPSAPELGSAGLGESQGVPEPASIALMGLALLGSLGLVRRKR